MQLVAPKKNSSLEESCVSLQDAKNSIHTRIAQISASQMYSAGTKKTIRCGKPHECWSETKRTAQLAGQLAEVRLRPLAATPQLQSCTSSRCAASKASRTAGRWQSEELHIHGLGETRESVIQNLYKSQLGRLDSVEKMHVSASHDILG
jgi:hypothetical protein